MRRPLLRRLNTAPIVVLGLVAGFGVADATGVRALGGLVLVAAGIIAGLTWLQRDGGRTTGVLSAIYLLAFVGSHLLALAIGAWPAVFAVSAVSAAAAYSMSDRKLALRNASV